MVRQKLEEDLNKVISDLGYQLPSDTLLYISKNSEFGDYSSNIPLQLANQKLTNGKQSPTDIANEIVGRLQVTGYSDYLEKAEVAGGGFINFFIKPEALLQSLHQICDYSSLVNPEVELAEEKKKVFMEYAQPNTHKLFHVGHTRNISLGESISRLLESQGNRVFRSTYGSDIGLPVAKALWGIKKLDSEYKKVKKSPNNKKVEFLGRAYAQGAKSYEDDPKAKEEIHDINKKLYLKDQSLVKLLEETKKWSFEYFDLIYQKLGTKFDRQFWESEVESTGSQIVRDNIGGVFERDQGAIIFPGEKYGLHNRVFISSAGNPTYEAKDLGLVNLKWEIWPFDLAIILSGQEQAEYFKIVFKALEQLDSKFTGKLMNYPYGMVNLTTGKMSSRTGEVVTFDWLYEEVKNKIVKIASKNRDLSEVEKKQVIDTVSLGAIKFSMLKYAPNTTIAFDLDKSVSLEGDSGPYVQYTYARAKSVLRNIQYDYDVELPHSEVHPQTISGLLEKEERLLLQKIEHFESIVAEAAESLHPNILATYLLEMASLFNLFYQKHPIIKSDKSELRLALTCAVAIILKQGLYLLGIEAPERM